MAKSKKKEARELEFLDVQPLFSIEDDLLIFKNGRVGLGFELDLLEMESQLVGDINALYAKTIGSLKELTAGTIVQKMDVYYDLPYQVDKSELKYYESKIHSKYMDRPILKHRSYIFFNFPAYEEKISKNAANTFFSGLGKFLPENPFEDIEKRMIEAGKQGDRAIKSFLSGTGIAYTRLRDKDLGALYYQYFNLDFTKEYNSFQRNISNDPTCVGVGEIKANVITMLGQGMEVDDVSPSIGNIFSPFIYPLTHYLQFPHILVQTVRVEDQKKALSDLDMDKKFNQGLAGNNFLGTQDHILKSEELDLFTADVRAGAKQLVSFNVSVIVYSVDDFERREMVQDTMEAFKSLNDAVARVEGNDTANLYFAFAPGNAWDCYRWIATSSDYAVRYFNFNTNYKSENNGILFCDRFRNPIHVNLFNTDLNNQNSVTIGPSGSGKSFTENYIVIQRHEQDARQTIIDVGGTYKSVIIALDGKYNEYSSENVISFNPFLMVKDANGAINLLTDINKGKILCLMTIFEMIWKGERLSNAERSILNQFIPDYYEHVNEENEQPSLNSFMDWLDSYMENVAIDKDLRDSMNFFDYKNFKTVFKPFTQGQYKDLLNAKGDMDNSDFPLVCYDMARLKDDAMIYPIVSTLIIQAEIDKMIKYPDVRKYLYMDEAWSMLNGSMGDFVEFMFRTVRKHNGKIEIITQSVNEIVKCSAGTAILVNSDTKIILNHKNDPEGLENLRPILGFTDYEIEKIRSLRVGDGWREIAVKMGDTLKVYILEASDEVAILSSSKPSERDYLRKKFKDLTELHKGDRNSLMELAVTQVVEDKHLKIGPFKK
jgi:conjugal transfer ATP-binding protein TraC